MSLISSGKIWPYAIGVSIIMVFGFCVATIMVTQQRPVEKSDDYMMDYNYADLHANELIQAEIDFNQKYNISYITESLPQEGAQIKYKITDKEGNSVDNAEFKVIITRPNNHKHDQELATPSVDDGVYTFSGFSLPKPGRWNVMARITIGEDQRFYNVKADTRAKEAFEY